MNDDDKGTVHYCWCDTDDDYDDNVGAVECRWVIECNWWCDTDDDDDNVGAVECNWVIECDWWCDTDDIIYVIS